MARVTRLLAGALAAPLRAARLLIRGERQLAEVREVARSARNATVQLAADVCHVDERLQKQSDRLNQIEDQLDAMRRDGSEALLRVNLQLSAILRALRNSSDRPGHESRDGGRQRRLSGRSIPISIGSAEPQWDSVIGGDVHPDPKGEQWLLLDKCPFCGHGERTVVVEWNKLIMLQKAPDQQSARYDYSLCHACGVVYASRRPVGERFLFLLRHFGEVTGKAAADGVIPNPLLNPYPLSEADNERLRRMASRGVWVSEHLGLRTSEYVEGALKDRFENSVHVDVLGNLVQPTNARVLEIRPRAGTIAESLRRLYHADVSVMPMWESQKFLLKELYGFDAKGLIDYDHFQVPFEGRFDLIVCNHMLVHAVRPPDFLREIHGRLNPGGYVYFYNEPEDRQVLGETKSIIAHLNPLHMQTFDRSAMVRALAANGFEVSFIKARNSSFMVLARAATAPVPWTPLSPEQLAERREAYRLARDRAILRLPADTRERLGSEWPLAIERGLARGALEFDEKGQLRFAAE
jgi:SAM-dependent methyltransferase